MGLHASFPNVPRSQLTMAFLSRFLTVVVAATALFTGASSEHIQYKIRNGEIASRAVNLGGWLVSEYWMCFTSPLYDGVPDSVGLVGEYAVMQFLGKSQGNKQFEKHWKTYIVEDDLAAIAEAGLNTVRVTTGFWIINDVDKTDQSALTLSYPSGGLKYLDTLINKWAVKYNLAVMISLHAHRGSQNGFDNSAPEKAGQIAWADDPANVNSSLNYATFIAHRYKNSPAFLGLNLMNEPRSPTDYDILKKYYKDAYNAIRADGNDCIIATSPWLSNQGPPTMDDFMTCPDYYNVWHEWHLYFKWGWEGVSKPDMLASAATYADSHLKPWRGNPMYMGEWSLATTDEVNLTKAELQKFALIQMNQYDEYAMGGWAFWSWRHDEETKKDPSGWSMRQLIKEKIITIPSTPANRTRNPLCKAVFSHDNSTHSSGSSSGSGSWSTIGTNSSVQLVKSEPTTAPPTTAPVPTTSVPKSASITVLPSLVSLVAATAIATSLL